MDPRISFVTLAVADLEASRRFYCDGLGWEPAFTDGEEVIMIQVGEALVLSLWERTAFAAEVGEPAPAAAGMPPITLAHNVVTPNEVDAVLETARAAGAEVGPAERRPWGGYTGYFADPDAFRWEVAWNPGEIGRLVVPDTQTSEEDGPA